MKNLLKIAITQVILFSLFSFFVSSIDCGVGVAPDFGSLFYGYATYGGSALAGKTVTAATDDETISTTTDSNGYYQVEVGRCPGSSETVTFTVCTGSAGTGTYSDGQTAGKELNLTISTDCPSDGGGGGGSGGGGGGAATAPVILPSETEIIGSIEAGETSSATFTADFGITQIDITVADSVVGVSVEVKEITKPTDATVAISSLQGGTYKYLEITPTALPNSVIDKVVIKFKVKKSWLSTIYDKGSVTLKKLSNGKWTDLPTTKVSEDSLYVYYRSETTGFAKFAITAERVTGKLTAFDLIDIIRDFYAGTSTYSAFDVIDLIRAFYGG